MGGFHDILSKVISSIRRFVDHNIWSMRRLGDYDVWLTTTYRLKFVELRRNSVENVPEIILVFLIVLRAGCCFFFFQASHGFYFLPQPLVGLEVGLHMILVRGAMLCT